MLFAAEETMMSIESIIESRPVREITIVPHDKVSAYDGAVRTTVHCPRCHDVMVLPEWSRDGDLTECCGLLLRVTRDAHGYLLEPL